MSKGIKKPPSRIKYEKDHPTISCRLTQDIYERLKILKDWKRKSFADALRAGLGILEEKADKEDEAYEKGYEEGFRKAEEKYKVTYRCSVCGKTIAIDSPKEKEVVKEYMEEQGWRHGSCGEGS